MRKILEAMAEREQAEDSRDWPLYRAAIRLQEPALDRHDVAFALGNALRSLVRRHGYDKSTGQVHIESRDFSREQVLTIGYRIAPAISERLEDANRLERELGHERDVVAVTRRALWALALLVPAFAVLLVLVGVGLGLHAHPRCPT